MTVVAKIPTDQANLAAAEGVTEQPPGFFILSATPATVSRRLSAQFHEEESVVDNVNEKEIGLEQDDFPLRDHSAGATSPELHSSHFGFDPYAELPPGKKPADIVLDSLRNIPVGTPVEEIKRAADAFGLDSGFMEAVAEIESDFDPTRRTGSYSGLFQLNRSENMGPEIFLTRAITPLQKLINSSPRRSSLNCILTESRPLAICI